MSSTNVHRVFLDVVRYKDVIKKSRIQDDIVEHGSIIERAIDNVVDALALALFRDGGPRDEREGGAAEEDQVAEKLQTLSIREHVS